MAGHPSWKPYAALAVVMLLAVSAYINSVKCSFHFDDYHAIVNNPHVQDIGNLPSFFTSLKMGSGEGQGYGTYRPVTTASLAINYRISGPGTWSYHVFNIALHLSVVAAIFFLALYLSRRAWTGPYAALIAAGIFALHPVHTNAVTYIIARSALLCTLFYLVSFYTYIKYADTGRRVWIFASLASFILALLSKELAVTLPAVILLYELLVRKGRIGGRRLLLGAYFLIDLVYAAAKYAVLISSGRPEGLHAGASRLMAEPLVVVSYLKLFVLPVGLNFYPDPAIPASLSAPSFVLPFLLIAALLALALYLSRRDGLLAFCIAWFFVTLVPETFLNLREVMVEYRLYLPSIGLTILTGAIVVRLQAYASIRKRYLAAGVLLLFGSYFFLTYERNKVYASDVTLWEDAVAKSPRSAVARAALGEAYLDLNKNAEAVEELETAFRLNPDLPGAYKNYNNLGLALEGKGENHRAYEVYMKALALAPRDVKVLTNLGFLCLRKGDRDEALMYFERVLAVEPDNAGVRDVVAQMKSGQ